MSAKPEPLFAELAAQVKEGDHGRALATVEKHPDVVASKVVCLVHLGRYEDAIKFTEGKQEFQFERAYCHYRLRQYPEALKIVRSLPKSARAQSLEAQILYRSEEYAAATKLFQELQAKDNVRDVHAVPSFSIMPMPHNIQSPELRTNLLACYVAQGSVKEALALAASTKDATYEFTYNMACAQIETGNLPAAVEALKAAEKICQENLREEGLSEEEMHDELAVIRVQMAFVLQMMAKEQEALKIYSETLANKPSDPVVAAVAANNIVTLRHDHDLFDSLKKVKGALTPANEAKLSAAQKRAIHINHCLVLLKMNKADQAKELVQTLRAQMPQSYIPTVIEASLYFRDKKNPTKSEELLAAYAAAHPKDSDYVNLCLAQLAFAKEDLKGAANALSRVASMQHRPAMVATLVRLYSQVSDITAASSVLDAAVKHWESKAQSSDEIAVLRLLQKESVSFMMAHKLHADAARLLNAMLKQKDVREADLLPQLVLAYAQLDPSQAESYAKRLPAFARTPVDVAALENAPSYRLGAPVKEETPAAAAATTSAAPAAAAAKAAAKDAAAQEKKKKHRKRKVRLPKNFDPNKLPDPERWLPKRERYASRKSRKKGASHLRGPQGATGVSAAEGSKDASHAPAAAGAPEAPTPGGKPAAPQPKGAKPKAEAKPSTPPTASKPAAAEKPAAAASSPQGKKKGKK